MIRHIWSVLCQKSITDRDTNNISLDVLEQLTVKWPKLPKDSKGILLPAPIEIISFWYRDPTNSAETGQGRMQVFSPSREMVGEAVFKIDLDKSRRVRTRVRMEGLPIPNEEQGYYKFNIELKIDGEWEEVATVPLEIIFDSSSP